MLHVLPHLEPSSLKSELSGVTFRSPSPFLSPGCLPPEKSVSLNCLSKRLLLWHWWAEPFTICKITCCHVRLGYVPSNYLNLHSYICSTGVHTLSLETGISPSLQILSGHSFFSFLFYFQGPKSVLGGLLKITKKRGDAWCTFYVFSVQWL